MPDSHLQNGIQNGARPKSKLRNNSHTRVVAIPTPAPALRFEWASSISPDQWQIYQCAIRALREAGIPFLLGGGFALAVYIGRWRNTKDIDFYIAKKDRRAAIAALSKAGFTDYFKQLPYDRKWIFRSIRNDVIVDLIWGMANQRGHVDGLWFERAPVAEIRGETLNVVPPEEFIWCKLYILQRDHCDWTDIMNLLYETRGELDWTHLLSRLDEDWPLLSSLLTLYGWLCPKEAATLPDWLRKELHVVKPTIPRRQRWNRIRLLDSRDWFSAALNPEQPLRV